VHACSFRGFHARYTVFKDKAFLWSHIQKFCGTKKWIWIGLTPVGITSTNQYFDQVPDA
jgi:hypothetical protein